jgi:predicted DCC family thiol-disulfide oxidoreductase YuxK
MAEDLTVLYDGDCGICTQTARVLVRLDARRRLRLIPLQGADLPGMPPIDQLMGALHAVDSRGNWFAGAAASVEIARRVRLLWPVTLFASLPLAMRVLDVLYWSVANHRQQLSRLLGLNVCKVPVRRPLP